MKMYQLLQDYNNTITLNTGWAEIYFLTLGYALYSFKWKTSKSQTRSQGVFNVLNLHCWDHENLHRKSQRCSVNIWIGACSQEYWLGDEICSDFSRFVSEYSLTTTCNYVWEYQRIPWPPRSPDSTPIFGYGNTWEKRFSLGDVIDEAIRDRNVAVSILLPQISVAGCRGVLSKIVMSLTTSPT